MLGKLSALKDKVEGYVDQAQAKVAERLVTKLHPQVLALIDDRVDNFRDECLQSLPREVEEGVKARSSSSSVAWVVHKILGDNTDVLVEAVLGKLRPGVVTATDGLSASAADGIIEKLKDWLDGNDADIEAAAAAGAHDGGGGAGDEAAAADAQEPEAAPAEAPASRTSLRSTVMAGVFGLDGQLPAFEDAARDLIKPLFAKLKVEVWQLVPGALQESLSGLVGDKEGDVDADAVEGEEGGGGFSAWMDKVSNKLQGKAGRLVDKVAAVTLDAIDGPMQELISKLVDDLEATSTAAAFMEIRQRLAEYKLIRVSADV